MDGFKRNKLKMGCAERTSIEALTKANDLYERGWSILTIPLSAGFDET